MAIGDKAMIKVNCEGTTEISGGRARKLNFVFQVNEEAVPHLLAEALKVRFRSKFRKQVEALRDDDDVLVTVNLVGDKVSLDMVDEKAARRAEIVQALVSGQYGEEEMLKMIQELKAI